MKLNETFNLNRSPRDNLSKFLTKFQKISGLPWWYLFSAVTYYKRKIVPSVCRLFSFRNLPIWSEHDHVWKKIKTPKSSSGPLECSFDDPAKIISRKFLKFLFQNLKNIYIYKFFSTNFFSKMFLSTRRMQFWQWQHYQKSLPKVRKFFA